MFCSSVKVFTPALKTKKFLKSEFSGGIIYNSS